uniref:NADH-ubiquinone oxidoreductase chain 2 n=1 Tax=Maesaipsyche stengeli TaxID=2904894 RepID=A0A9E8RT02_9NEOP|nr:NADH dehydrogenase subunit 2 [Maesaipsyche stengeli]UZZ43649.1 NADH dehydrogenase subunit 2 [Maesaipsyche stengeli]
MNFNISNMMFTSLLIFSTLISISSNSWLLSWFGLEINLMFFIPILSNKNNSMKSEFTMKYFLIQAISSSNLMYSIILFNLFNHFYMFMLLNIYISLLLKLASAPLHWWMIQIIESLDWFSFLLISTWQKIAPFILLSYLINSMVIVITVFFNCLLGAVGGINQLYIRKLLTFSSINNMGWMFSTFLINETLWMLYFFLYSMMMCSLIIMFNMTQINNMNQLIFTKFNYFVNLTIIMNFFSMGGMPPFFGFFPKWMIINNLMLMNKFLITFMVMCSLINLLFYFRLILPLLLYKKINSKYNFFTNLIMSSSNYYITIFNLMIIILSPLIFYIF